MTVVDVDVSLVGRLIGDPTRGGMLSALFGGRAMPAGELASVTGVQPSTASEHLARLVDGGLLAVAPHGRHRYYRLASDEVAEALEALSAVAPVRSSRTLREAKIGEAMRRARTCYDHLAGEAGVAVADAFLQRGWLADDGSSFRLTDDGRQQLLDRGLELRCRPRSTRPIVSVCLDWSERRPRVAGVLGAALLDLLLERRFAERLDGSRALRITPAGRGFLASLGANL